MKTVNILWTGGWDSTYRVLEALLLEDKTVQPHYIVDPELNSLLFEIRAMDQIRKMVRADYPDRAVRLLPTIVTHIDAIHPDDEIAEWNRQLSSITRLGTQYEWLARYAKHHVQEPELMILRTLPGRSDHFGHIMGPYLQGKGHECRMIGPFHDPGIELFSFFRFPVIHLFKSDMRTVAEDHGFIEIMKMTWFCHDPTEGLPCGLCSPCKLAPASGITHTFYRRTTRDRINLMRQRLRRKQREIRNYLMR
jgi:hypothetical protein